MCTYVFQEADVWSFNEYFYTDEKEFEFKGVPNYTISNDSNGHVSMSEKAGNFNLMCYCTYILQSQIYSIHYK